MEFDLAPAFGAGLGSGIMLWGSWASGLDSTRSAAGVHGNPGLGKVVGVCGGLGEVGGVGRGLGKAVGVCGGLGEVAGVCRGLEKAARVHRRLEKVAEVCTGDAKTVAKSPSSMLIKWILEPWQVWN